MHFARNNLALILTALGRYTEALQEYDQLVDMEPGIITNLLNRSLVLRKLDRTTEAIETLSAAHDRDPEHVGVCSALAMGYRDIGNFQASHTFLKK